MMITLNAADIRQAVTEYMQTFIPDCRVGNMTIYGANTDEEKLLIEIDVKAKEQK